MMRDLRSQELLAARAAPKLRGQTGYHFGRFQAVRCSPRRGRRLHRSGGGGILVIAWTIRLGKTTLLMMIAGFESANEGSIRVGDRDLTYVPPNERGIGMVFSKSTRSFRI
jgi:hypothetical protein